MVPPELIDKLLGSVPLPVKGLLFSFLVDASLAVHGASRERNESFDSVPVGSYPDKVAFCLAPYISTLIGWELPAKPLERQP